MFMPIWCGELVLNFVTISSITMMIILVDTVILFFFQSFWFQIAGQQACPADLDSKCENGALGDWEGESSSLASKNSR
jgi:hypothetical protein